MGSALCLRHCDCILLPALMTTRHAHSTSISTARAGSAKAPHMSAPPMSCPLQTNRKLLIGRAMGQEERAQVLDLLRCDPVVAAVYDTKSEELGPGVYRFKAEIEVRDEWW